MYRYRYPRYCRRLSKEGLEVLAEQLELEVRQMKAAREAARHSPASATPWVIGRKPPSASPDRRMDEVEWLDIQSNMRPRPSQKG
jgi:hypothetical protein